MSLVNPEYAEDPVCAYARLGEEFPLVRNGFPDGPRLADDAERGRQALSDPRLVVDYSNVPGHRGPGVADQMVAALAPAGRVRPYGAAGTRLKDGVEHARRRRLVTPAFTVRRTKAPRPPSRTAPHR